MGRVLVIGGSNTDLVCRSPRLPVAGETLNGTSFAVFAGGKGANQAVAASRAGAAVTFAGAVGDDDFGRQRRDDLVRDGIDVTCVDVIETESSGVALIVVDDEGENQIVVIAGANGRIGIETVDRAADAGAWDALLLVLEVPFETVRHAVSRFAGQTQIVLNAAPYDPRAVELLPHTDVLICNETEASGLLGYPVTVESALDDARSLRALGCTCAIITLGAYGAFVATVDDAWVTSAPPVEVVDTTGAGDAFCGSLTAWLACGASLRDAVSAGVVAGSIAVTRNGAQPSLPSWDDIMARLAGA
jgi:ribokinase